jgi:hypothetical protein
MLTRARRAGDCKAKWTGIGVSSLFSTLKGRITLYNHLANTHESLCPSLTRRLERPY